MSRVARLNALGINELVRTDAGIAPGVVRGGARSTEGVRVRHERIGDKP